MKQVWAWLDLDRLDLLLAVGLVMLWFGLDAEFSRGIAWAACGGVVILFCLVGALRALRGS